MDFLRRLKPKNTKVYFSRSEFQAKGFPVNPNALESYLLANMVYNILNPIRVVSGVPIYINDCYRDMVKYRSLIKNGYNPSPTSDHFWGTHVETIRIKDKNKYGSKYTFSMGAIDFKVKNLELMVGIFNTIRELVQLNNIKVGQCILESKYEKNIVVSRWIHISNPLELIYNEEFIKRMNISKGQFLVSQDNGKTYKAV